MVHAQETDGQGRDYMFTVSTEDTVKGFCMNLFIITFNFWLHYSIGYVHYTTQSLQVTGGVLY